MNKLNIAFIIPEHHDINEIPYYIRLGPLKLEAYCRDIANFDFYFEIPDIFEKNYDVFAISTIEGEFWRIGEKVLSIINILRRYNKPILLGGNLPRYYPEIEKEVNWVCYYEGEKPLRRTLLNIFNNEPLKSSKEYELLSPEELNLIPPINVSYLTNGVMPLQLGIGCPNNCIFCDSWGSQGKKLRHPSIEKMISDIDYYADNGINTFHIIDDTIFSDREYYIKVFNHIKSKKLRIVLMYIGIYLDDEELSLIADLIHFGITITVDACNERIFKMVNKKGNFQRIPYIVDYLKSKNFFIQIQIVVNFPFETEKDRQEGIQFFSNLNIDGFRAQPLDPLPNTPVEKMVHEDEKLYLEKGISIAEEIEYQINYNLNKLRRKWKN